MLAKEHKNKLGPIREMRLKNGLTQRQVEKLTGISQSKLSYLERGFPATKDETKRLVKAFGLNE